MDNNIKDLEKRLLELSNAFIILFDNLKKNGIIDQQEYNTHTVVKKEFLQKICNHSDN